MWKKVLLAVVTFLLLFSWVVLYGWGDISMGAYAPYENIPPDQRPPVGTWQRDLNDLFCRGAMRHFLSYVLVAVALVFTIYAIGRLRQSQERLWVTLLKFSLGNLILVAVSAIATLYMPVSWEARFLKPPGQYRPGYEFTYEYIILDVVMFSLWVYYNVEVVRRGLRSD